jgi:ABC-type uncharacterized transport system substrate-binding protein
VLPPAAALERDIVGLGVAELGRIFPTAPINMPGAGLVASLGRPGGNTTGLANMTEDLTPKVVDILRIVVPKAARIAVLYNPANPSNNPMLERIEGSIKKSGGAVHATPFRSAEIEAICSYRDGEPQRPRCRQRRDDYRYARAHRFAGPGARGHW